VLGIFKIGFHFLPKLVLSCDPVDLCLWSC
jgi:hypothetical protein